MKNKHESGIAWKRFERDNPLTASFCWGWDIYVVDVKSSSSKKINLLRLIKVTILQKNNSNR